MDIESREYIENRNETILRLMQDMWIQDTITEKRNSWWLNNKEFILIKSQKQGFEYYLLYVVEKEWFEDEKVVELGKWLDSDKKYYSEKQLKFYLDNYFQKFL